MSLDTGVPPIAIQMKFHILFPSVIGQVKIEEYKSIKEKYAGLILDRYKNNEGKKAVWAKLCNTCQVDADRHIIKLYYDHLDKHVQSWFEEFNFPPINYKTFMWVNVHTWESYQETHDHIDPGCILAGNYNLQLNDKDRPAIFQSEAHYKKILVQQDIKCSHPALADDSSRLLDITEGDLVLFSPHQKHLVPCATEKHDGYRITISFNVCTTTLAS